MFVVVIVQFFSVEEFSQLCNLPLRIEPDQVNEFVSIRLTWKESISPLNPKHEDDGQRH